MSDNATSGTESASSPLSGIESGLRVCCLLAAVAIWIPGLHLLSRIWEQSEFFGHGYLIPIASAFLIYTERRKIVRAVRFGRPPPFGFLLVLPLALGEVLAISGGVATAAGIGIPLLMAATVYAVGGRDAFLLTRLPLGLLIFMVPPPGFVNDRILVQLKLMVTQMAVSILQALDYTVAAVGNQLLVPGHTLFVADACSGLISIITLLPLSVIVAYFLSHGLWRRFAIVLSVVPLAVGANIVRVIVTVALVSSRGIESAEGLLHDSFGLTTFIGGTLALLCVARLLR
jgi:exosortase